MFTLESRDYARVQALFQPLDYHLIMASVLAGHTPGTVLADNVEAPQCAYMHSPEGKLLVGSPDNTAFNTALGQWIIARLNEENDPYDGAVIDYHPDTWEPKLETLLSQRPPLPDTRRYYSFEQLRFDWRASLALTNEFEMRRITEDILNGTDAKNLKLIHEWINKDWGSIDAFLQRGFGFCIMQGDKLASWSLTDCIYGYRCEIGIETDEAFRRRGLASTVVGATVEHALSQGLSDIGWHCWDSNIGSIGVAEKVGFRHVRSYNVMVALNSAATHYGFKGNRCLQEKKYDEAIQWYTRSLAENAPEWVYYRIGQTHALLGNNDAALDYLEQAVERGWDEVDYTRQNPDFAALHTAERWQKLFDRLDAPAKTQPDA